MNTQFQLQTFDKHQGWQTLETFAHLTDADAREHEIQESFTEQGLDVKTRVQRKPEPAQGNLAGMTKRQERNHFLVSERDLPAQGKAQHSPLPWHVCTLGENTPHTSNISDADALWRESSEALAAYEESK